MHRLGQAALVVECGEGVAGYATLGARRSGGSAGEGEIYELYLRPEYHGTGLGRRLFREARRRLTAAGLQRLTVWSLAENEIGCRFYRGVGGIEVARSCEIIGGARLRKIGFWWP
jgi:ribosomal protein S18 acetylase RimI-like enzyme